MGENHAGTAAEVDCGVSRGCSAWPPAAGSDAPPRGARVSLLGALASACLRNGRRTVLVDPAWLHAFSRLLHRTASAASFASFDACPNGRPPQHDDIAASWLRL